MRDVDQVLKDAGERWRSSLAVPSAIDTTALVRNAPSRIPGWPIRPMVAAAAVVVLIAGVAAFQGRPFGWFGGTVPIGASAPPSSEPSVAPSTQPTADPRSPDPSTPGREACAVTLPDPVFVAPAPFPASPPASYRAKWYGSSRLWVMLSPEGETWSGNVARPGPIAQKTFWWSADWDSVTDLQPAMTVTGTRLDGPGSFRGDPATNASADFGTAMLVGVDVPTGGCWKITGEFRSATLSYVMWAELK